MCRSFLDSIDTTPGYFLITFAACSILSWNAVKGFLSIPSGAMRSLGCSFSIKELVELAVKNLPWIDKAFIAMVILTV